MKYKLICFFVIVLSFFVLASCTIQGERGADGRNGKSAYELAVQNGFEGTVEEWLESLKGETGISINESVDSAYTTLTFCIDLDNMFVDLRGLFRNVENAGGILSIDWGDGSIFEVLDNEDVFKHTYKEPGEYTVKLNGLEVIGNNALRAQNSLIGVCLGKDVVYIGERAFNECILLKEIKCLAAIPPTVHSNSFDTANTDKTSRINSITVLENSLLEYTDSWKAFLYALTSEGIINTVFEDIKVTVGDNGDYSTINEALEYLSIFYPAYRSRGIDCIVEIQSGTIINEQIFVEKIDLSYITITTNAPDNTVKVDVSGWSGVTHDTRGNRPFFSGENGARLPAIRCLFSCITPKEGWNSENYAVGYFCNRGSSGVVLGSVNSSGNLSNVGFEGFYDNIIANNNSEIVLREAICRNAERYGVVSRHISRVSARSADITNCGEISAYADRASMMDVRHANLSESYTAIVAYHASTVTANEANANNMKGFWAIDSRQGSTINCQGIKIDGANSVFKIGEGGTIISSGAVLNNIEKIIYSTEINSISSDGIIYE